MQCSRATQEWGRELQTKLSALCFASLTANPLTTSDGSVNIYWEIEPSLTDSPNPDSPFGADLFQDKWCIIQPREPVCTRSFLKCKVQPSVSPCVCRELAEVGWHGLMVGMTLPSNRANDAGEFFHTHEQCMYIPPL